MKRYRSQKEIERLQKNPNYRDPSTVWPPEVHTLLLTYQTDIAVQVSRPFFFKRDPEGVYLYLLAHHGLEDHEVILHPNQGPDGCFMLRNSRTYSYARKDVVESAKRHIAMEIGLSPAKFQVYLPEFDEDFLRDYRYHYYVNCKNHEPKCVRPDHLVIHRSPKVEVKYPLTYSGRTSTVIELS